MWCSILLVWYWTNFFSIFELMVFLVCFSLFSTVKRVDDKDKQRMAMTWRLFLLWSLLWLLLSFLLPDLNSDSEYVFPCYKWGVLKHVLSYSKNFTWALYQLQLRTILELYVSLKFSFCFTGYSQCFRDYWLGNFFEHL